MTDKYVELRRLAEAATPGPWNSRKNGEVGVIDTSDTQSNGMMLIVCQVDQWDFKEQFEANRKLIAECSPSTILSLLADLEKAQKNAERYQKIKALAVVEHWYDEEAVEAVRLNIDIADTGSSLDDVVDAMQEQKP